MPSGRTCSPVAGTPAPPGSQDSFEPPPLDDAIEDDRWAPGLDLRLLELARLRKGDEGLHRQMVTGVLALITVGVDGGVPGDDVG